MSDDAMHLKLLLLYLWLGQLMAPSSAQGIAGFVSLDCGSSGTSPYTDDLTQLIWESDSSFGLASASLTTSVSPPTSISALVSNKQLESIRYFPGNNQTKYCYTFGDSSHAITFNSTYLVRATFWAGSDITALPFTPNNADGILRFQLLLNSDVWTNVSIPLPQTDVVQTEVYVVALSSSLSVCLSGFGLQSFDGSLGAIFDTPFISSLEIRQIPVDVQPIGPLQEAMRPSPATSRAVYTVYRLSYGSSTGASIRYPDDNYDRIWRGQTSAPQISTTHAIVRLSESNDVPLPVMQTAYTTDNSDFYLNFTSDELVGSRGGYAYSLYFAEISGNVTASGQRIFGYTISNRTSDGLVKSRYDIDLFAIGHYQKYAAFRTYNGPPFITIDDGAFIFFNFTSNQAETSTLGPLICALELYNVSDHDASSGTHDVDASAVGGIREAFPSALGSWSGDPCLPYSYDWLRCGSPDTDGFPRIISLSLAQKGLSGVIPPTIADLTALQTLDLQGNNLTGSIPNFLGSLPNLTTLLLQDNDLSGYIPSTLLEKVASRSLNLSVAGNRYLCAASLDNSTSSNTCNAPTKSPTKLVMGLSIGGVILLILVAIAVFCLVRKCRKEKRNVYNKKNSNKIATKSTVEAEVAKRENPNVINLDINQICCFTYEDIKNITYSFARKLGRGGFGDVYHGNLRQGGELEVAVKVSSSNEGTQAFVNEVTILSRVHHRNLVKLIGYCKQNKLMLVYEYMPNGSLDDILQGNHPGNLTLTWAHRLRIAVGAADGLGYLHNGCTPPIIHRDVKTSNILLDITMEGKISDFGISRSNRSPLSTFTVSNHVGTKGYIPPDILNNDKINEKVDVYAFGVVLLELVTGRKPIFVDDNNTQHHIITWVKSKVAGGELETIVDPTIGHTYNVSSIWKVIDVALLCVSPDNHERPEMSEVFSELKVALVMEVQGNEASNFPTNTNMNSDHGNVYARLL